MKRRRQRAKRRPQAPGKVERGLLQLERARLGGEERLERRLDRRQQRLLVRKENSPRQGHIDIVGTGGALTSKKATGKHSERAVAAR